MDALAALARAGFDLVHAFDAAVAARAPGLAALAGPERRGLVIGNTRALWPVFSDALRDPELAAERDPLDRYTERVIDAAFPGARIFYGHRAYGGAFVPLQHLAVATGLGWLAPSRLVIHPIYGPWFALRAAVMIDGEPVPRLPIAPPCHCDASCTAVLARAQQSMDGRDWVAVRDACSLRAWRYTDDQLHYHYASVWGFRRQEV